MKYDVAEKVIGLCVYMLMLWLFLAEDTTKATLSSAETVITLHVENPEIILVEDTTVDNTNALILDVGYVELWPFFLLLCFSFHHQACLLIILHSTCIVILS